MDGDTALKKTLLFSDVHLKVTDAARSHREAFVSFLRAISPDAYDRIICLGDLFDFWFEYRHVIFSGYFEVLRAFRDLGEAGGELHLVCGNHDFWGGRFLREELGFHIHPDSVLLDFGGRRTHLVHGDGVCPSDHFYRVYKRIARNPFVVEVFRLVHPDWAMAIARAVSHGSRSLQQNGDPAAGPQARALRDYAEQILVAGKADVVLCGHAHAPSREEIETPHGTGLYLNTGDWMVHRSHVVWDGRDFHLMLAGERP